MDQLYLSSIVPFGLIIEISSVCILLALKSTDNPAKFELNYLTKYLKAFFDFHTVGILWLRALGYDLNHSSAYGYLSDMFYIGITSNINNNNCNYLYHKSQIFLMQFVEDICCLVFLQSNITFAVIKFQS